MSRFVFFTWEGGGNVPPAVGLAQALRARGHGVLFAGYAGQEAALTARGLPFRPLARSQAAWEVRAAAHPWDRLREGVLTCPAQLEEVPAVMAEEAGAVAVLDCMLFAALAAAERGRLPAAVLVHSAPGALLHPGSVLARDGLRAPLNALRAGAGLPPLARVRDAWLPFPALCTTVPSLDPAAAEAPETFEYVGPIVEEAPPSGWRAPWASDDPRPLVVVSFSTGAEQRSRIERTLAALAGRPYRVLATTSGSDVSGLAVPANAALVGYVPHAELMPGAVAAVCHAGHGTVSAALAHGVPLVCLPNPIIADQIPLAARVQFLGAGRALDGEAATPEEIGAAVDAVVTDPAYAAAARRLAGEITALPGAALAATGLERLAERQLLGG